MIKRESYLQQIRPFINQNVIKVLTGIRRCGKSVMLDLIKDELIDRGVDNRQIISINLESGEWLLKNRVDQLYDHVKEQVLPAKKMYLFLDEIQEINGWEKAINAFLIDFDLDIYITGSNAKLLSGELATYLGGRYVEFNIYPFSFKEVYEINRLDGGAAELPQLFHNYLRMGGMPFIYDANIDENSQKKYLSDIYDSVVLKDIVERNKVRNIDLLQRILLFLMVNIGNPFSAPAMIKFLKNEKRSLSQETVYNYLNYCEAACFAHLVEREDIVGKQVLKFQEKIYLTDHGFREVLYGNNERDIQQVLENIVYMELLRRGYAVKVGKVSTTEVDFVADRGSERIYYQVAYILAEAATVEREFSPLEAISDNYPKFVLTMDDFDRSRNGIQHLNIIKFLLAD
ncbi:AAA family ATPase [Acetobacterium paludosum]|uniref:AAA family ATPase n=1 Tax=Acetobacterium paludosum TaxID=52693 RepID=A0A923KWA7_9FIRM|nr:ATP-binding protein [Acetobacterium paludosum]MBC3887853.1 AAA family ATPase [Acetobacterium paludosum]